MILHRSARQLQCLPDERYTHFFFKGWHIRDGNMRLVEISKFLGMETSLIEKLRDGGNLLISQAPSLRDNNILITCTSFGAELL